MTLKKLPQDVQSILSASAQINTFRKAVEELVNNALDAESKSIAIRLHIDDGSIQVIDNGDGIQKHDYKVLGQKHMTSKITDLTTLRSAPKTYGYRGESLANIIIVSQTVKIISRHKDEVEDTWVKTFHNGKEKRIAETSKRPSKGTTVEIKGFLYNLNIQKKTIDTLNELQNIKQFLEHISLVHNNISLSLRDDSKNDLLFKIHKKRDIYQTLSSLYDIKDNEIQELQVEKNNYRVRGFIGKTEKECHLYWIYINGKFISNNSKVHMIVNDNMKTLLLKNKQQRGLKSKNHTDENRLFKKNIPYYFIFITCPYVDYVISDTPKQSVLEFKNWEQIKHLLQKLVSFYVGDINLKEIKPPNQIATKNQGNNIITKEDTRDQVKKIVDKILGSHSKKKLQIQKGIKGKLIKRNLQKKRIENASVKLLKVSFKKNNRPITPDENLPQNEASNNCKDANMEKKSNIKSKIIKPKNEAKENIVTKKKEGKNKTPHIPKVVKDKEFHTIPISNKHTPKRVPKKNRTHNLVGKKSNIKSSKDNLNDGKKVTKNIFNKLEKDFDSVEKRSKIIAEKAETFLKDNVKNTIQNARTDKIKLKNYIVPLPPKINQNMIDEYIWMKMRKKTFKTTYDLVQTILRSQQELYAEKENNRDNYIFFQRNNNSYSKETSNYCSNVDIESKLTFESHRHYRNQEFKTDVGTKYTINKNNNNTRFITKQSRDNFIAPNEKFKCKLRNELKQRRKVYDNNRIYDVCLKHTIEESMYTIEFSKTCSNNKEHASRTSSPLNQSNTYENPKYTQINSYNRSNVQDYEHIIPIHGNTYTISPSDSSCNNNYQSSAKNRNCKYTNNENVIILSDSTNNVNFDSLEYNKHSSCNTINEDINTTNYEKNLNIIFVSKSKSNSPNTEITNMHNVDPLNVCENILESPDIVDANELRDSFKGNNIRNESLFQIVTNSQEISIRGGPPATIIENVSHHFSNNYYLEEGPNTLQIVEDYCGENASNRIDNIFENHYGDNGSNRIYKIYEDHYVKNGVNKINNNNEQDDTNNFNFKDRLRFLPKGMSQIFAICNSKTACDYNLDEDYFEDSIYNNFANDVQVNVETYEPIIQNVKDYTTANIQKVNDKLNKANGDLTFDGISLKEAKVLGQIDCKFIAAVIRYESYQSKEPKEYLVLFDQHAVHERIRLEKNLADYLNDDQWKSVSLDNIALNLSKDEVLYLHNYESKFIQLGLQWTILGDSEVLVNAIPEAILGKNLREVENIIKAVRNLIKEEINIIKMQKGCMSLYPKSIMELVFSEACRYAIKFGDRLSKTDCKELLQALSNCKTPFQCAHGRPVMAVIMDVITSSCEYKMDIQKIKQFKVTFKRN